MRLDTTVLFLALKWSNCFHLGLSRASRSSCQPLSCPCYRELEAGGMPQRRSSTIWRTKGQISPLRLVKGKRSRKGRFLLFQTGGSGPATLLTFSIYPLLKFPSEKCTIRHHTPVYNLVRFSLVGRFICKDFVCHEFNWHQGRGCFHNVNCHFPLCNDALKHKSEVKTLLVQKTLLLQVQF